MECRHGNMEAGLRVSPFHNLRVFFSLECQKSSLFIFKIRQFNYHLLPGFFPQDMYLSICRHESLLRVKKACG